MRHADTPGARRSRGVGFTLIELMIVIAIMAIIATMAMPSYQDRTIRSEVLEGLSLADFAKQGVAAYFAKTHTYPADNAAAGLPPADRIVGNYVSSISVHGGSVDITFGNQSNHFLMGKHLSVRPASVNGYPQVPLAWVCGHAKVPANMTVAGQNTTDLAALYLPLDCRSLSGS